MLAGEPKSGCKKKNRLSRARVGQEEKGLLFMDQVDEDNGCGEEVRSLVKWET